MSNKCFVMKMMNKLKDFFEEYWCLLVATAVVVFIVSLVVWGIVDMINDGRRYREETARLELKYRYSISHHHAGRCSYDTMYYTDAVETDGNLIKFVDQDGKPRLIEGDVTVTENGTPRG